jgi:protein-S-isoprenylcysteine O-methyltransferase
MNEVVAILVLFSWTILQLSLTEFWIRFWFFPQLNTKYMMIVGIVMTTAAQFIRSLAMVTCGESFNHLIQRSKKDNHKLITHGV